jgi:hypothetical protein
MKIFDPQIFDPQVFDSTTAKRWIFDPKIFNSGIFDTGEISIRFLITEEQDVVDFNIIQEIIPPKPQPIPVKESSSGGGGGAGKRKQKIVLVKAEIETKGFLLKSRFGDITVIGLENEEINFLEEDEEFMTILMAILMNPSQMK